MVRLLNLASLVLFAHIMFVAAEDITRGRETHRGGRGAACASGGGKLYGIQLDQYPYLPYAQITALMAYAALTPPIAALTTWADVRC